MKRIGLLGGSFDPVHVAHIALARAAMQTLALDEIQLIPAADPWQRPPLQGSAEQRLAMLALACAKEPGMTVNPIEIQRGGPTYTIDTLKALPKSAHYVWLLGSDQLANFCTWRNWQDILDYVDLAVAQRPGAPLTIPPELNRELSARNQSLRSIPFSPTDISASSIRLSLKQARTTDDCLDPAVMAYIAAHHLYR